MPGAVKSGGAWQAINAMYVKVSGAWQAVQNGYVKAGGVWQPFYEAAPSYPPLTASADPSSLYWNVIVPGSSYDSDDVTATGGGGSGSYSYAWEITGGLNGVNSQYSATTGFSSGDGYGATARCLITDNVTSNTIYTNDVSLI
jgi:hypothetical protein